MRTTRSVRLFFAFSLVTSFQPFLVIWIIYLLEFRHLSLTQIGLLESFFWGASVLAEVPTGAFADRFGRRITFSLSMLISGVAIAIFGIADSYTLIMASYVVWAVGMALRSGNDSAYLYEVLDAGGRADEFTKVSGQLGALTIGATVLASVSGGVLAAVVNLQAPILVAAATSLLGAVLALALPEPTVRRREQRLTYMQTLREAARALRRDAATASMILLGVTFAIATVPSYILLQPFLRGHGVPISLFGVLRLPNQALAAAGSLFAYRLPRILGFARSQGMLVAVTAAVLIAMSAVDHIVALIGFGLIGLALTLRRLPAMDYVNRRIDSDTRATILSVPPLGQGLLFAILLPLGGWLGERSMSGAFLALGVLFLISASASYLLWLRADRADRAAAPVEVIEAVDGSVDGSVDGEIAAS